MYVYLFNSCLDFIILILDLFSCVIKKENIVVPFVFRLSLSIHLKVVHGTMYVLPNILLWLQVVWLFLNRCLKNWEGAKYV